MTDVKLTAVPLTN